MQSAFIIYSPFSESQATSSRYVSLSLSPAPHLSRSGVMVTSSTLKLSEEMLLLIQKQKHSCVRADRHDTGAYTSQCIIRYKGTTHDQTRTVELSSCHFPSLLWWCHTSKTLKLSNAVQLGGQFGIFTLHNLAYNLVRANSAWDEGRLSLSVFLCSRNGHELLMSISFLFCRMSILKATLNWSASQARNICASLYHFFLWL